jgi:transposase
MPIAQIARVLGISRNTVKAALASDGPPKYRRLPKGSRADAFEPRIRELLRAYPRMPSTVIAERIGWPYSIRTLSGKVAELRPVYLPPDPAGRTTYLAGEIAQHDFWFPPIELPVGVRAGAGGPAAAGADDDHRLCAACGRAADSLACRRRPVRGLVAAAGAAGGGAAHPGVGR